jgi:hypothetical protein
MVMTMIEPQRCFLLCQVKDATKIDLVEASNREWIETTRSKNTFGQRTTRNN